MTDTTSPSLKHDFASALSLLMVSIPISAGIAVASKASPELGIITAIFGALFFGFFSSSSLLVYGPAAGLAVFLSAASNKFGDYSLVSGSIVLAGVLLVILSFFKVYRIVNAFPTSVIKGMSAGIGLILVLKMIPHLFGYDAMELTSDQFYQNDGRNTLSEIVFAFENLLPGATIISIFSLGLIFGMSYLRKRKILNGKFSYALVVVTFGVVLNQLFRLFKPEWQLMGNHVLGFGPEIFVRPPGSLFTKFDQVFETSLIFTAVIFLESLITIDIFQKIDPKHSRINARRELFLMGVGNIVLGFLGALPIMPVLIRSTANVEFGAKSRWSVFMHGLLLLVAFKFNHIFNLIPMASVAVILVFVGVNLVNVKEINRMVNKGKDHWFPFFITLFVILFVDLLWGIFAGFMLGLYFSMRSSIRRTMVLVSDDQQYLLKFHKDVTFLNKSELREHLGNIPLDKEIIIDGTGNVFIDKEIEMYLEDYYRECEERGCKITFMTSRLAVSRLFKEV